MPKPLGRRINVQPRGNALNPFPRGFTPSGVDQASDPYVSRYRSHLDNQQFAHNAPTDSNMAMMEHMYPGDVASHRPDFSAMSTQVQNGSSYSANALARANSPTDANVTGFEQLYGEVSPGVPLDSVGGSDPFRGPTENEQRARSVMKDFEQEFGQDTLFRVLEDLKRLKELGG